MNGRFFDGRMVEAGLYDSKQRYRRSGDRDDADDGEEAEKQRLDAFAEWIMKDGDETAQD